MESPPKLRSPTVWTCLFFFLALLVQVVGMTRAINPYDECLELFAAVRVLHGDFPYRDFWTMYGPAQFYVIAGIFKVFGISILVARIYHAFAGACVVIMLYLLARKMTNAWIASLVGICSLLWTTGVVYLSYEFPTYPALALTLLSFWLLTPVLEQRAQPLSLAVSGVSAGLVTLFRHDFGFYVFVCELIVIVTQNFGMPPSRQFFVPAWKRNLKQGAIYFLGMAVILVPAAAIILRYVPVHDLYFDLIFVPARIYPKVRSMPFPGPSFLLACIRHHNWLGVEQAIDYFPPIVAITSLTFLFATRTPQGGQGLTDKPARRLHLLLTLLLVLMTVKGLVRVSPVQLIQAILLAILVLGVILYRVGPSQKVTLALFASCLFVAALPSATVAEIVCKRSIANVTDAFAQQPDRFPGAPGGLLKDACHVPPGLERMRCFVLEPFQVQAIEYIQAHTSPSDTIYVGAGRHDKLWLNDLAFYFVSERMSGTKWHDLHPGIETTEAIQQQMISDLQRTHTQYIVLENSWDNEQEPNQSRFSSGVTLLDDFIHSHYAQVASFGPISILKLD